MSTTRDKVSTVPPVRVATWGTGAIFQKSIGGLLRMRGLRQVDLVAVTDEAAHVGDALEGVPKDIPFVSPGELDHASLDYLIITNKRDAAQIRAKAEEELGFPGEKILTHRILQLPGFDFRAYHELRGRRMGVMSDDRWGPMLCRLLQMEHRSPLGSARFTKGDYLRVLHDIPGYRAVGEPTFLGRRVEMGGARYLAFALGDVVMRLDDAPDPLDALSRWHDACADVGPDGLFVELSTLDPVQENEFEGLREFPHRVCLVPYETSCPHSVRIPLEQGHVLFSDFVEDSVRQDGGAVTMDFVGLLLGHAGG